MLSCCYSFCFYFLALTLYPSLFCHLHLCPDLSFNLSIVFVSFWLFFFRSRLWSQRSRISGVTQGSAAVSYCLVEVGDHGVQISIFIYQRSKRCKSTTYSCLESTHHCWIIQLLEAKPDSWLGWFPCILKACLESYHHHVMVASNICTWECSGSVSFNT